MQEKVDSAIGTLPAAHSPIMRVIVLFLNMIYVGNIGTQATDRLYS